eukprot:4769020-Pyramimonas_sp.AAC.2
MEDFVSYDGERLLTLPEMRTRHVGKKFGPEQGEALRALRRILGCTGDGTLPTTHRVGPRKGPLEEGLRTTATHEPEAEIRINIRKRRGKAAKNVADKRRVAHESLLRFRTRDRRIYNITRAIGQRRVKDGEGHPHVQYLVDWEIRQADGSRYPADWINSGDIAEGASTDPAKWKVKVADEGEHAHRTFLRVTGQTVDERTQQVKTIRGKAFRRHHTDGSTEDRRQMPFR